MKKIFILDDDVDVVAILNHILGKQYEVLSKTDASDIYPEIVQFRPDLIFMDNFIGEKNATEIINNLRSKHPSFSVPVVLFSASANLSETAASIGASGYLEKPSGIDEIRKCVKSFVETTVA